MTVDPLVLLGVGVGGAGAAKLATAFAKDDFERWGYPAWSRTAVGAIEVGVAAAAFSALREPAARPVAAVGTLCSMAGAIATLARDDTSAANYLPAVGLAAAAVAALVRR